MRFDSTCEPHRRQADADGFETDPPSDDDDDYLTHWERDFLASVGCQDYDLTDAQESKLAEIEPSVEERRALAWERYERRLRTAG